MRSLHLLRHGETELSADGTFCGDIDTPLSDVGRAQAEKVAERLVRLNLEAIYVSPKMRAQQTAAPICKLAKLEPRTEDGLREISYGTWDGRKESEIKLNDPELYALWGSDPAVHAPPGGENGYAIAARAVPIVDRVGKAHEGNVLLVSHKATVRVIVCALLGLHIGRFRDRIACPTASLTSFEFGSRGPLLVRIGETEIRL
ncbi:MAG: histidine phosphatase family protein [Polyangiaceae bacterium]